VGSFFSCCCAIVGWRLHNDAKADIPAIVPGYTYSRSLLLYSRSGSGVGGSVIDYCLVSQQGYWSNITRFTVGAFEADISDHAPLSCSFYLPAAVGHRRTPPSLADGWPTIKWDSSEAKRVQYVSKLRDCEPQRQQILNQLSSGVPLAVVSNQWCEVIWKVAADVYGVSLMLGAVWLNL
jgi:hypothetical protein